MSAKPTPPSKLGPSGRALWSRITKVLDLDPTEVVFLALACRQADDVAKLEKALTDGGTLVEGSTGQPRLNPCFAEVRAGRLAVEKLLGRIGLPEAGAGPDAATRTPQAKRAQHAANVRWLREGRKSDAHG